MYDKFISQHNSQFDTNACRPPTRNTPSLVLSFIYSASIFSFSFRWFAHCSSKLQQSNRSHPSSTVLTGKGMFFVSYFMCLSDCLYVCLVLHVFVWASVYMSPPVFPFVCALVLHSQCTCFTVLHSQCTCSTVAAGTCELTYCSHVYAIPLPTHWSLSPLISSRNTLTTHLIFLSHNHFLFFSFLSQVLLDFAKMEAYLGDRAQAVKLFETTVKRFPTHDRWESGRGSEWIVILEDSVCLQKDVMWSILCVYATCYVRCDSCRWVDDDFHAHVIKWSELKNSTSHFTLLFYVITICLTISLCLLTASLRESLDPQLPQCM